VVNDGTAGGLNLSLAGLVEIRQGLQVDMELFAIASVCHREGIPWRSFQSIAHHADRGSKTSWQAHVRGGQESFLQRLGELAVAPW
jgi:nucleoside phosphorylase